MASWSNTWHISKEISSLSLSHFKKSIALTLFAFTFLALPYSSVFAAPSLKPRVLVIPFDNMMGNKDYDWMKESISDNLKEKLIKTNRFDVMDVGLLRQINPDVKLGDLTGDEATAMARRLNCEAAIIGRYITKQKGDTMNALIQIEAVNTVSNESIVIKSEYADLDGNVFKRVEALAKTVADEFVAKLPPVSATKNTRSNALEKIIDRLEHPPKGFFDTLAFQAQDLDEKQQKKVKFKPEFDIDTFIYDLYLPDGVSQVDYKYEIWGKNFEPYITADSGQCFKGVCAINGDETEMLISRIAARTTDQATQIPVKDQAKPDESVIYKIRIHRQPPPGQILGRLWLNAGYPYMKSLSFINPAENPAGLLAGGAVPFDGLGGVFSVETGFAPGRWQLPGGVNWSLVAQFQYAKGDIPLNSADSGLSASIDMFSMGGGLRIDRPFMLGNIYGISPMIGFNVHYQIFSHSESGSSFSLMGLNPEVGIIQYFRIGARSNWKISLTTIFGSYLYQDQNLSYIRANIGVEYAIK